MMRDIFHRQAVRNVFAGWRTIVAPGLRAVLLFSALVQGVSAGAGSTGGVGLDSTSVLIAQTTDEKFGFRFGSVIMAPIPFENPSLGSGLALGGAYMFKLDGTSDTSTIGAGAFRTSNGSEGYGFGGTVNFGDGRWSVTALGVDATLNYAIYAANARVPIRQNLAGVKLEFGGSVSEHLKLGFGLDYGETTLAVVGSGPFPGGLLTNRPFEVYRLSLLAEYDARDDTIYPTDGFLAKGRLTKGFINAAGGADYEKGVLSATGYWTVFGNGVLAAHATFCAASSSAPFFDSCGLGAVDGFRGYVATEFIKETLISAQAEYRGRLGKRLGYVVFAGAAVTGDTARDAVDGPLNSAAGAGLRFRLSRSVPVDYAVDVSVNERGESLLYVSVGQRF